MACCNMYLTSDKVQSDWFIRLLLQGVSRGSNETWFTIAAESTAEGFSGQSREMDVSVE